MCGRISYYLVGDFNRWQPCETQYRFKEVTSPYGLSHRPDLILALGSYSLETTLPRGRIRFKIVQDGSWNHPWSVWDSYRDVPYDITQHHFRTRHNLHTNCIFYRGAGTSPHAEFDYPGGMMRWDFHPDSQTLAIHREFDRSPGLTVGFWRTFSCRVGTFLHLRETEFDAYYCLPYGYRQKDVNKYAVCFMFDGRGLLFGEEDSPWHREWNRRQASPRISPRCAKGC